MPFFIRKPLSFLGGLFRLNLSKSGVGVSVGPTGLRVGVKPDGHAYVTGGREGLYFREGLGSPDSGHEKAATPVAVPVPTPTPPPADPQAEADFFSAPWAGRDRLFDPAAHAASALVKAVPAPFAAKWDLSNFLLSNFGGRITSGWREDGGKRLGVLRSLVLVEVLLARAERVGPDDPLRRNLAPILAAESEVVASGRPIEVPAATREVLTGVIAAGTFPLEAKAAKIILEARRGR
jgi:hypothetical protein